MSPPPATHLVVLAHPDRESFCASVAQRWCDRARRNHQVCDVRDLYSEGFDPILKVNERPGRPGYAPLPENLTECRRLHKLDVLVFVYPIWFGSPPAMLKGYLERVVGAGISFGAGEQGEPPLAAVRLIQISTSASREAWLAEKGVTGALHTIFDQYHAEVFGARTASRLHLDSITEAMTERLAMSHLLEVDDLADKVCAEANADRWDRERIGPVDPAQRIIGRFAAE